MLSRLKSLFDRPARPRPAARPARRRPSFERLEDRTTPSVVFATYGGGTYAYNSVTATFRRITPLLPVDFSEGSDGTLYASFNNNGTYRYTYFNNLWVRLTPYVAPALDATDDNALYASFSFGT